MIRSMSFSLPYLQMFCIDECGMDMYERETDGIDTCRMETSGNVSL